MTRLAAILWSGSVGGAETFTADLCRKMRDLGADVHVVFVTHSEPLDGRIGAAGIPHTSLGLARGREVLYRPRALATTLEALRPDGVLLPSRGYLAAAVRIGGYRGRVVAVEHGATVGLGRLTLYDRLARPVHRTLGFWAIDVDVAVSEFVLCHMRRQLRKGRLVRIYNGIDLDLYTGTPELHHAEQTTIAYAGRLIDGKGVDVLLRAFAAGAAGEGVRLRIGGDGPARPTLERLASKLGLNGAVEFTGWSFDMPSFWRACDVAAMPSDRFVESFGMAAIEAMACATPVVVTANGALPELVDDGVTGFVVPRGNARVLADALVSLTRDGERRCAAGRAARARCEEQFDIRDCAAAYLRLFQSDAYRESK
jgi:glycosyltransferase involved in cell wall biosynthesis